MYVQKTDILNRGEIVKNLLMITEGLSSRNAASVFALNGDWGSGKTFILRLFEDEASKLKKDDRKTNKYFIFHYDCWQYDYYDEPLIAIVAAMLDTIKDGGLLSGEMEDTVKAAGQTVIGAVEDIAREVVKNKLGVDVIGMLHTASDKKEETKKENEEYDSLYSFKRTLEFARKRIRKIAKTKNIIFVVDELDRCLPEYEMKVLERIHHLFVDIPNVTVIVAMDKRQLTYSIRQIFGEMTDVDQYLRKFIDFTITIDRGRVSSGFQEKYKEYIQMFQQMDCDDREEFEEMFCKLFSDTEIRTQEKLLEKAECIHKIVRGQATQHPFLMCFEMMWIRLSSACRSTDLTWIMDTGRGDMSVIREAVGSELFTYLQELINGISESSVASKKLRVFIKEKVIWIFDVLCRAENSPGGLDEFLSGKESGASLRKGMRYDWNEDVKQFRSELESAAKFVRLSSMMIDQDAFRN